MVSLAGIGSYWRGRWWDGFWQGAHCTRLHCSPQTPRFAEAMEVLISTLIHGRSKSTPAKRAHVEASSIPKNKESRLKYKSCRKYISKSRRSQVNFRRIRWRHLDFQRVSKIRNTLLGWRLEHSRNARSDSKI